MATWISTHGVGVIKDARSSFKISIEEGGATVQPTSPNALEGAVHFVLPSPPRNNPNITDAMVEFSPQSARIDELAIFFANEEKFRKSRLQKTSTFQISVASAQAVYDGKGIAMTLYIKFDQVSSAITFQSVAVATA